LGGKRGTKSKETDCLKTSTQCNTRLDRIKAERGGKNQKGRTSEKVSQSGCGKAEIFTLKEQGSLGDEEGKTTESKKKGTGMRD